MTLEAGLIGRLFDSVADDDAFTDLSKRLTTTTRGVSVLIQTQSRSGARTDSMFGLSPDLLTRYNDYYWSRDVWATGFQAAALDRAVVADSFISEDAFRNSEIYNDLLRGEGDLYRCLCFVSDLGGGERFVFGAHRTRTQPMFEPEMVRMLQELHPLLNHLARARRRAAAGRGRLAERLLDDEADAVVVVSRDGAVRYLNAAASTLLAQGSPLKRSAGRLSTAEPACAAELARAIAWACTGRGGRGFTLPGAAGAHQIAVDPLGGASGGFASVRIRNDEARLHCALAKASADFGFTPAERRLAEALLRGASPGDYAEQRGLRMPTVRSQLRALFAKAGVGRQSELILALKATPQR